jgi:hypothetical protein
VERIRVEVTPAEVAAPAWAWAAFVAFVLAMLAAVVLAAVAALSIRDNRRAAWPPAHGNQEHTDLPQPAESAPGNGGEPAAGPGAGRLPGSGDGPLTFPVAAVGEPSAQR